MGKSTEIYSADDYREIARRCLPKFAFDFVDGGSGRESARQRNEQAFHGITLVPRIGLDTRSVSLRTTLMKIGYAAPFGVAPIGLGGIVHPEADLKLARVAAAYEIPYIASTTSSASIEDIARASGVPPWFQLYASKVEKSTDLLMARAREIGCPVLIVTVDTPAPGRRLRDLRNRLTLPFRPGVKNLLDMVVHPAWTLRRLAAGPISFPNIEVTSKDSGALNFAELMALQTGGLLDWNALTRLRDLWPRALLLKGVLSVEDALAARALGIDGVIVSNHGGRQLDSAPAPIELLPEFITAGLDPSFLMLDSGVRSGEDIIKVIARGGQAAFLGRPLLFALASAGEAGVAHLVQMLIDEMRVTLRLLGASQISDLYRNA